MAVEQPTGGAVLYVSSNVAPEVHDAFTNWCDTIHHFDTMRIEGFLSLRRFELVDGTVDDGGPAFATLTLYQVEEPANADFSTPSYAHHSATYTPPPDGVVDGIAFDRTVYTREVDAKGGTQLVGGACVTLVGANGSWMDDAAGVIDGIAGVVNTYRVSNDDRAVVFVDVEDEVAGRAVLARLSALNGGGNRQSVQLFKQVFPTTGVLLRDREFRS